MRTLNSHTEESRPPRIATTAGEVGLGAAAGAAVEYLFDPDRGRSRRAKVRDKLASGTQRSRSGIETLTRDMAARSGGVVAAARYRVAGRDADDQVLHDRVRETLGRHVSHPRAVHVEVSEGVATLTGDVLVGEEGPACRAIKRVPGIKARRGALVGTFRPNRGDHAAGRSAPTRFRSRTAATELVTDGAVLRR